MPTETRQRRKWTQDDLQWGGWMVLAILGLFFNRRDVVETGILAAVITARTPRPR